MATTVTLNNSMVLGQPTVDAAGVTWWHRSVTGWRDGVAPRTAFTDRPAGYGAYDAIVWPGRRVIVLNGTAVCPDHETRLRAMRQLQSVGSDGSLLSLRIADELDELEALVRRSDKPTLTMSGPASFDYSMQWTAPEPRLLETVNRSLTTPMAQSGAGGVAWNGPGAGNRLSNAGFETGVTSPWTVTGGTFAASSTHIHSGTFAGQITPSGTAASVFIESEKIPTTPGAVISATVWVWFTTAVTTHFSTSVNWYNSSNTYLSTSSAFVSVPAATWTQASQFYVAPANAAFATLVPTVSGTPAASNVFYLDDMLLRVVTGVQWNGPASPHTGVSWGQPVSTGVINLDNTAGTAVADVTITIRGPVQRPAVSTSAGWIIYNGILGPTDTLVINTGTGLVQLNGVNRRAFLTRADWFQIPAGQNLLVRFTGDVQNATASLTAEWRVSHL